MTGLRRQRSLPCACCVLRYVKSVTHAAREMMRAGRKIQKCNAATAIRAAKPPTPAIEIGSRLFKSNAR